VRSLVEPLGHGATATALAAERGFLARLGAGCAAALAAYATVSYGEVQLQAIIGAPDGRLVRGERAAHASGAAELGAALADELMSRGGRELFTAAERVSP
jgi:hydroxymethylbilane synthase